MFVKKMGVLRKPFSSKNPIVFMDIKIDKEYVGRLIIELRKDRVPRTAENFRGLCTGEFGIGTCGKKLHYKGIRFHKVQRMFMVQGGDIVNNNGSTGESIYGPIFEDENYILLHEEGAVSMANYQTPNTNNSQFFITSVQSYHLNGTNVVVGYVLRGLGILTEMERFTTDEGEPTKEIFIADCGELDPGEDWNYCDKDETEDKLPPFPSDWDNYNDEFKVEEAIDILNGIKNSGNYFWGKKKYLEARRKYRKAQRYYTSFRNNAKSSDERKILDEFHVVNLVNIAAVELKFDELSIAKHVCTESLAIRPNNAKALYRRGQAEIGLKNYEEAIKDLRQAYNLVPEDKAILREFERAKKHLLEYRDKEKIAYKNLFK